ncbi:MAG TPA: hypothetical protein DDX75_13640 [Phycisphaerales bacterium]|nr:hypothetical protein [Phycisphaerales bacterium]
MFCYHNPPMEMLESIATYGCEAGNVLLGIRSNGLVSGCSFLKSPGMSVFELASDLKHEGSFDKISNWLKNAPEPCNSCQYLNLCKGGCHAVSQHLTENFSSPDPDCPKVVEYNKKKE